MNNLISLSKLAINLKILWLYELQIEAKRIFKLLENLNNDKIAFKLYYAREV